MKPRYVRRVVLVVAIVAASLFAAQAFVLIASALR